MRSSAVVARSPRASRSAGARRSRDGARAARALAISRTARPAPDAHRARTRRTPSAACPPAAPSASRSPPTTSPSSSAPVASGVVAASAARTFSRLPRNVVHAPPSRTCRSPLARRPVPVEAQVVAVELGGVGRLADLRLRRAPARRAARRRAARVPTSTRSARSASPVVVGRRSAPRRARSTGAGVEPLLQLHQAHAGDVVAGQQRPLDRRRAAPARQQREVQVDHRQRGRARAGLMSWPKATTTPRSSGRRRRAPAVVDRVARPAARARAPPPSPGSATARCRGRDACRHG